MNELRFVRREERSLILATENDDEFRLVIDDLLMTELKHANRKEREGGRVRPREIQSLVRAGKTRAEVAALTGLDEADIERYEEPVLAERRYILERAHAVQVRTDTSDETEQTFGGVIAERLLGLDAEATEWAAWRDEEAGWLVSLEFISHDVAHHALWGFDHRKQTLAPANNDAVNLSKHGEVGDRLIPKLRAVDNRDRTSQFAPVSSNDPASSEPSDAPVTSDSGLGTPAVPASPPAPRISQENEPVVPNSTGTQLTSPIDTHAEYARRREIDQRAIKSEDSGPVDFSQTADLLDALRRRRGERLLAETQDPDDTATTPVATPPAVVPEAPSHKTPTQPTASAADVDKKPRSIWGGAGVASGVSAGGQRGSGSGDAKKEQARANAQTPEPATPSIAPEPPAQPAAGPPVSDPRGQKKGRASIPSWDDILFGTRSDEDPAT